MTTTNEISPYEDAAMAAGEWWAKQVGAPTFDNGSQYETGQSRVTTSISESALAIMADRHPVSGGAQEGFSVALALDLIREMGRIAAIRPDDPGRVYVSLDVDYSPDRLLAGAAERAGVHLSRFPIKSHTTVYADHITAQLGYGAPTRLIWTAEGFEHPPCNGHQYAEGVLDERLPFNCSKPRWHEAEDREHQYDLPVVLCQAERPDGRKCLQEARYWTHDETGHSFVPPEGT